MFQKLSLFTVLICILISLQSTLSSVQPVSAQRFIEFENPSDADVTSATFDPIDTNNAADILDMVFFPAPRARLNGIVFFDKNRNGIIEDSERGLSDVTVIIETETDGTYRVSTDENGAYSIELYVGEEIKIIYEVTDSEGVTTQYVVTTEENGGTLNQTVTFDQDFDASPVGLFFEEVEEEVIVPKAVEQIVEPVTILVRSGQKNIDIFPLVIIALLALLSGYAVVHKH